MANRIAGSLHSNGEQGVIQARIFRNRGQNPKGMFGRMVEVVKAKDFQGKGKSKTLVWSHSL